jgi:23S rRNA pseudouridine1911/1915/1917 synthase
MSEDALSARVVVETIPTALDGERLDRVVALLIDVSRAASAAVVAAGAVSVDGSPVTSGKERVRTGAVVAIDTTAVPVVEPPQPDAGVEFAVIHADDAVVVVDKPAGLVVHPGAGNRRGTLVNGLLARFPDIAGVGEAERPGIVHRLDAGSSGLLVVARTPAAADALVAQFGAHTAGRRYEALVWGHPSAPHGIIDAPIGRDPGDPLRMALVADGRPARTEYEVVRRLAAPADVALLSCRLQTGRTHQIRVHLTGIGHPLVGDPVYGDRRTTLGLTRPFLHAGELSFDHPVSGDRVTFHSPLPADLADLLARLDPAGEA